MLLLLTLHNKNPLCSTISTLLHELGTDKNLLCSKADAGFRRLAIRAGGRLAGTISTFEHIELVLLLHIDNTLCTVT